MAQRLLEQKIKGSHCKPRSRDEARLAMRAPSDGEARGKGKTQLRKRRLTASVGPRKAFVHLEKQTHSSMTRTRKAKGRDDFVHLLRQAHRTETRKVMEKGSDDGSAKGTPTSSGRSKSGKRTDCFVQASWKEVSRWEMHVIIGMFRMCKIQCFRWMQIRREVCARPHGAIC